MTIVRLRIVAYPQYWGDLRKKSLDYAPTGRCVQFLDRANDNGTARQDGPTSTIAADAMPPAEPGEGTELTFRPLPATVRSRASQRLARRPLGERHRLIRPRGPPPAPPARGRPRHHPPGAARRRAGSFRRCLRDRPATEDRVASYSSDERFALHYAAMPADVVVEALEELAPEPAPGRGSRRGRCGPSPGARACSG